MSDRVVAQEENPRRSRVPAMVGVGIILGVVASFFLFRSTNEAVTRERLAKAREQWAQSGPKNYDLEVVVTGRQEATYEVEVRNGEVAKAMRNRAPLTQQRTFRTWSGPGMFDTIETDVDTLEFAKANPNDSKAIMLTLRARFDSKTGLPLEYLRSQWGTNHDVTWRVSKFEVK
jgi:hypothetical protein